MNGTTRSIAVNNLAQNAAVMALVQMTQQNSALVEEGAAAQSLKDEAERVTQAVGVFEMGGL